MTGKRGGKRAGAGRKKDPTLPPDMLTYTGRLTPAQYKLLKMWGGGNASAGLRWLIDTVAPLIHQPATDSPHSNG